MNDLGMWWLLLWLPGVTVPQEPIPVTDVEACQRIVAAASGVHGDCISMTNGRVFKVYPDRIYEANPHKPYPLCTPSPNDPGTINCRYGD